MELKKGDKILVHIDAGLDLRVLSECSTMEEPMENTNYVKEYYKLAEVKAGKRNYVIDLLYEGKTDFETLVSWELESCDDLNEALENSIEEHLSELGVKSYILDRTELDRETYHSNWEITIEE